MGLRFRKRIKILPGVSLNLSKSGISTSIKAGAISWNSRTGRTSVKLPGAFAYRFDTKKIIETTKAEFIEIAKQAGLKGYSKLNKQELVDFLQQNGII